MRTAARALVMLFVCVVLPGMFAGIQAASMAELKAHPVRLAILGDRTGGHTPGVYGEIVAEIERLRPDLVLTVGDMIEGYTTDTAQMSAEWQEYLDIVAQLSAPIYYTAGNHDITTDEMVPHYRKFIGEPYYSFTHRGVHFVMMDNSRIENSDDFSSQQLAWLINDLEKNSESLYTIVFHHKPFWIGTLARGKADTLHAIFARFGVDAVFTGHFHRYFAATYDGIDYTSIGSSGGHYIESWGGFEYHFGWVTIDDQGIHTAPIMKNSVYAWDEYTAEDLFVMNRLSHEAIFYPTPVVPAGDGMVVRQSFTVEIRNSTGGRSLSDTLRWQVPDGWSVEPSETPVEVPAGESESVAFVVSGKVDGDVVPTASIRAPYGVDRQQLVKTPLRIAPSAACRLVSSMLSIDGVLDEDIWMNVAVELTDSVADPVSVRFAFDDKNLYVAARCADAHMDQIRSKETERDGTVYADDYIGFFFQPVPESPTVYQVYFNPDGVIFDQEIVWDENWYYDVHRGWNGEYVSAVARDDSSWTVEARIPFDQFGVRVEAGQSWGLNIRRKQSRLSSDISWQPVTYDPKQFGVLEFE